LSTAIIAVTLAICVFGAYFSYKGMVSGRGQLFPYAFWFFLLFSLSQATGLIQILTTKFFLANQGNPVYLIWISNANMVLTRVAILALAYGSYMAQRNR